MTSAPTFELATETSAAPESAEGSTGVPPVSMQQLCFSIQRLPWSSLVVVPAVRGMSAMNFAQQLCNVGRLALGEQLRMLDARDLQLTRTAPLVLDTTASAQVPDEEGESSERVLVVIDSVLTHASGIPIALAADGARLCIELGKTALCAVEETSQLLGPQRSIGCVTLPPP